VPQICGCLIVICFDVCWCAIVNSMKRHRHSQIVVQSIYPPQMRTNDLFVIERGCHERLRLTCCCRANVRLLGHRIGIAAGTGVYAHRKLTIAPEFALQQFHAGGGGLQFYSGFKQRPAV